MIRPTRVSERAAARAITACGDADVLDLRGLVAPEPLERALAAADRLEPGARIEVLTPMMPLPLIELLGARGLEVAAERGPNGSARVAIRRPG